MFPCQNAIGAFGLSAIVSALPPARGVDAIVREAGHGDAMLQRVLANGLIAVPVAGPGTLARLAAEAVQGLGERVNARKTGAFLLAHSVLAVAPADVPFLDDVLAIAGFPRVPSMAITGQPCAVLHTALRLAGAWSRTLPAGQHVLLVGADRAYSAAQRVFFGSVMGDAAVAMAVTPDAVEHRVLSSFQHTYVMAASGELSPPNQIASFREQNPALIRSALIACLARAGRTLREVALFVPHTPNLSIWDAVARLAGIERERILTDYIGETGHLNSNDSFVHYERAVRERLLRRGDLALLINPGFGGTRGCTLIQR